MPLHEFQPPRGRIEYFTIESPALAGNLLGDPSSRRVGVYLPAGYDDSAADYPLFVDLAGFTSSAEAHLGWSAFGGSLPQRIDRLMAMGRMGPVITAFPDCYTSLGGNQYIDSTVLGPWATYLVGELLPGLEARYRIRRGRQHRGLFGKSSGGYGALVHGMLYAEHWGAVACHSGDMAFEWAYLRDMPELLLQLAAHQHDIPRFIADLAAARKAAPGAVHALMLLAMAASYDPDPSSPFGIRLPVTHDTCELIPERWQRWLAWDPLQLIEQPRCQDNLRRLRGLFVDCGSRDQYFLVFGARRLRRRLDALGIGCRYEEFDDNHSGIDYRLDESLPFLYAAVTGGAAH